MVLHPSQFFVSDFGIVLTFKSCEGVSSSAASSVLGFGAPHWMVSGRPHQDGIKLIQINDAVSVSIDFGDEPVNL